MKPYVSQPILVAKWWYKSCSLRLQQAEAHHAQATQGGSFAPRPGLNDVPSGFFDVEALKIAAAAKESLKSIVNR